MYQFDRVENLEPIHLARRCSRNPGSPGELGGTVIASPSELTLLGCPARPGRPSPVDLPGSPDRKTTSLESWRAPDPHTHQHHQRNQRGTDEYDALPGCKPSRYVWNCSMGPGKEDPLSRGAMKIYSGPRSAVRTTALQVVSEASDRHAHHLLVRINDLVTHRNHGPKLMSASCMAIIVVWMSTSSPDAICPDARPRHSAHR